MKGVSDWPLELTETEITWNLPSFHSSNKPFGHCEAACGIGYQSRTKEIDMPSSSCVGIECEIAMLVTEKKNCYAGKCPGKYSVWYCHSYVNNILHGPSNVR